ncbi:MAG: hypothetical protein GXY08_04755 [Ruminococcus sp.]|nr:hypothetical protein [Ruminococcus sp.]
MALTLFYTNIRYIPVRLPFAIPVKYLFIISGALLLVCTVYGIKDTILSSGRCIRSKARIIDIQFFSSSNVTRLKAEYIINGHKQIGTGAGRNEKYGIGEEINITVNPRKPDRFWLEFNNSNIFKRILPWILSGLLSIFLLFLGISMLITK